MAAILPFLERQNDPAETDEQLEALETTPAHTQAIHGLGRVGSTEAFCVESRNLEALDQSHNQLVFTAWQRDAVLLALESARFQVQIRSRAGAEPRSVFIVLDKPLSELIPDGAMSWSPPTDLRIRQFRLLSWTSKMGAPSFNLPAGSAAIRGACPGSAAGQSINSLPQLKAAAKLVKAKTGLPVHLDRAICQHCYAEGGQYSTANVQMAQVLRHAWVTRALKDGTFVETMKYAISNADFVRTGRWKETKSGEREWIPGERHPGRYFRLHDSGDFFSPAYLRAWGEVVRSFPNILFWAPTRIWATAWGSEAVAEATAGAPNFIIRPSAFHVNEPPPDLSREPGWAAGTTVYADPSDKDPLDTPKAQGWARRDFDWDCGVYAIEDATATCRGAIAPDGKKGCRACWRHPNQIVNYTLH